MIEVKLVENSFDICTSCHSDDDLRTIKVGKDERQTITFKLCKKCREEMLKKLNS